MLVKDGNTLRNWRKTANTFVRVNTPKYV